MDLTGFRKFIYTWKHDIKIKHQQVFIIEKFE
jgi:hypothetical protein